MAEYRKLGRPSDQRRAILRNLTTTLLWKGSVETTMDRAKEVRSIAEKLITVAVKEHKNTVEVDKEKVNERGDKVTLKVTNDAPSRLAARRKLMSYLYEMKVPRNNKESKMDYRDRTKDVRHPLVEKMFTEIGPKYDQRRQDKGPGGYTRIIKKGPRRGDAAEMVILQLVD